jgi:hypothetical protein
MMGMVNLFLSLFPVILEAHVKICTYSSSSNNLLRKYSSSIVVYVVIDLFF